MKNSVNTAKNSREMMLSAAVAGIVMAGLGASVPAQAKAKSTVDCMGVNSCKGKSACKGANGCKGKNECKGQGMAKLSAKACKAKGGHVDTGTDMNVKEEAKPDSKT